MVTERVFNLPITLSLQPWKVEHVGPATNLRSQLEWRNKKQAVHRLELV